MKSGSFRFTAEKSKGFICLLFLLIILLLPVQSVLAHGGGTLQVANVPIATYQVSVWTNPPTARANQPLHVTVGIATAVTGEPVLDATVNVVLLAENGDMAGTAVATTEQSVNHLFYEADLLGTVTGNYEVQVSVIGSEGSGSLSFPLVVEPISIGPWIGWSLAGAAILGIGLRFWRKEARRLMPRSHSVD